MKLNPFPRMLGTLADSPLFDRLITRLPAAARDELLPLKEMLLEHRGEPAADRKDLHEGDVDGRTIAGVGICRGDVLSGGVRAGLALLGDIKGGSVRAINFVRGDVHGGDVRAVNVLRGDIRGGTVKAANIVLGDVHGGKVSMVALLVGDVHGGKVQASTIVGDIHGGTVVVDYHLGNRMDDPS